MTVRVSSSLDAVGKSRTMLLIWGGCAAALLLPVMTWLCIMALRGTIQKDYEAMVSRDCEHIQESLYHGFGAHLITVQNMQQRSKEKGMEPESFQALAELFLEHLAFESIARIDYEQDRITSVIKESEAGVHSTPIDLEAYQRFRELTHPIKTVTASWLNTEFNTAFADYEFAVEWLTEQDALRMVFASLHVEDEELVEAFLAVVPVERALILSLDDHLLDHYRFDVSLGHRGPLVSIVNDRWEDDRLAQEIEVAFTVPPLVVRLTPTLVGFARFRRVFETAAMTMSSGLGIGIWIMGWYTTKRMETCRRLAQVQTDYRQLTAHLQTGIEEERATLSRELNERLGQTMDSITASMLSLQERMTDSPVQHDMVSERLTSIVEQADATLEWVRRFDSERRPPMLEEHGITAALEWRGREFQRVFGIPCDLSLPGEVLRLEQEKSTALYRICQEALTNVGKHAEARRVGIRLSVGTDRLRMVVHDDGKGIPEGNIKRSDCFGVVSMRERAISVGGTFTLKSRPGQGTAVQVEIPVHSDTITSMEAP